MVNYCNRLPGCAIQGKAVLVDSTRWHLMMIILRKKKKTWKNKLKIGEEAMELNFEISEKEYNVDVAETILATITNNPVVRLLLTNAGFNRVS